MITMLLVAIIMLNALIAIMGDTYDRVSETRLERGLQGRALLLIEIEEAMTRDQKAMNEDDRHLFPCWCHLLTLAPNPDLNP